MIVRGNKCGVIGELSPEVRDNFGLPSKTVCLAELHLGNLFDHRDTGFLYRSVSRFPSVKQDMALVMDEEIPASKVIKVIKETGGKLLNKVTLFDIYQGEQISPGKKSLTFSLTYQSDNRNLTDEEVQKIHKRIEKQATQALEASLRG